MAHDHRRTGPGADDSGRATVSSASAPGKRTLVERAFEATPAPLQRKASEPSGEIDVHAAAQRGVSDRGGPLPHLDTIQRAFGAHDVSNVQAHTGPAAARASHDIGAAAYATGHHVAFGGTPDLHTAAHEAAHVVQQREGVHLSGGVGQQGDAYERHADAVADQVVAGGSAETLLSQMAPSSGSRSGTEGTAPIQRQATPAGGGVSPTPAGPATAPVADTRVLSGSAWCAQYPTGTTIEALTDATFRANVQAFHDAMVGAATPANSLNITISATFRPAERAHLMHYAFHVHQGTKTPAEANTASAAAGITINWDHGNLATSQAKAGDMVTTYDIAYAPALHSRHTEGKAIDWTLTWNGSLMIAKKGETAKLDCTGGGGSANLHLIGASYGVHKLDSDPPHWSTDGA